MQHTQHTLTLSGSGEGSTMKCFKSTFQFAAKADEPADSAKVNGIKFICNYDMARQSEGNAPRNPLATPCTPFQCCHFTRLSKYLLRYFQMHFNVCALTTTTTTTKRRRGGGSTAFAVGVAVDAVVDKADDLIRIAVMAAFISMQKPNYCN